MTRNRDWLIAFDKDTAALKRKVLVDNCSAHRVNPHLNAVEV